MPQSEFCFVRLSSLSWSCEIWNSPMSKIWMNIEDIYIWKAVFGILRTIAWLLKWELTFKKRKKKKKKKPRQALNDCDRSWDSTQGAATFSTSMHVRYGSSRIGTILMQETSGHPCQHNSGYEEEGSACLMSWCVYLYCLNLWSACKLISLIDLELSPNEIIAVYSAVHEGPLCFLPIKIYYAYQPWW